MYIWSYPFPKFNLNAASPFFVELHYSQTRSEKPSIRRKETGMERRDGRMVGYVEWVKSENSEKTLFCYAKMQK